MPRDSFSTHSATKSDTTPKVCATVAPPWSVVTRPDRSRSGSSAPPAHIAVPTASWTGVWWKRAKCSSASEPASQAAAPDSACEGPIMAVTVPAATGLLRDGPLWTSRPCHTTLRSAPSPRPTAAGSPRSAAPAPRSAVAHEPGVPEQAEGEEEDRQERPEEVRSGQDPEADQYPDRDRDERAVPAQPAACRTQRLGRAGERLPSLPGQAGGERPQLLPVGRGVGAGQPLVTLLEVEPALGDGRAQDLGDLLPLGVRGADPAGARDVGGHCGNLLGGVHDSTMRRAGWGCRRLGAGIRAAAGGVARGCAYSRGRRARVAAVPKI